MESLIFEDVTSSSRNLLFYCWKRLLAPRVGASKRILAPRLGNGIPLSFIFSIGATNLLVGKRLLAPRVDASKSKEILAPRLEKEIPLLFLLSFLLVYCRSPDFTKSNRCNKKSGKALQSGSCLLFVCCNAGYNRLILF